MNVEYVLKSVCTAGGADFSGSAKNEIINIKRGVKNVILQRDGNTAKAV